MARSAAGRLPWLRLSISLWTMGLRRPPGHMRCAPRLHDLVALSAAHVGEAHRAIVHRIDGGYGTRLQNKWLLGAGRLFMARGAIPRVEERRC
jgi:hypothetical protein